MPEGLRFAVPLLFHYTRLKERGISLLSMIDKIYVGILIDRVLSLTGGLIDNEQRDFRIGREFVN